MAGRGGRLRHAGLVCLALALAMPAAAQTITRAQMDLLGSLDTRMDQMKQGEVSLDIGAGTILITRLGPMASKVHPIVPYLSLRYHDWLAWDENELRVNIIRPDSGAGGSGWRAGPMVKVDIGRGRFGAPELKALPAIGLTPEVGAFASYTIGPARIRLNARTAVSDAGHGGSTIELNLRSGLYENGGFGLAAETEATWVSGRYMRAFYGVNTSQANARLPAFMPGGGFKDVSVSVMGQYHFNPRWSLIGVTQYVHLLGDAADSPLTTRRGSLNRLNFGSFVVYTF